MVKAWNKRMEALLRPIIKARVQPFLPLFPNTFPLAYHFLGSAGETVGLERLRFADWNQPDPMAWYKMRRSDCRGILFYSTTRRLQQLDALPPLEAVALVRVSRLATTFRPAYLFVDSILQYRQVHQRSDSVAVFDEEVFMNLVNEYDRLEIFTDTEEQAGALAEVLRGWWGRERDEVAVMSCESWSSAVARKRKECVARLYLFSPARSPLLLGHPDQFLRFDLPTSFNEKFGALRPTFETHITLIGDVEKKVADGIMNCCEKYHRELYAEAGKARASRDAAAFKELAFSYNLMARGLNLRDTFASPLEFATTLADHHEGKVDAAGRDTVKPARRVTRRT